MIGREINPRLDLMLETLKEWTDLPTFGALHDVYFQSSREQWEIEAYREKRGPLKRLRDEIVPVYNHLRFIGFQGEVKFTMSNDPPDAWIRVSDGLAVGLEVTVALARSQFEGGKRLNRQSSSPGFPHLQDNNPQALFDRWAEDPGRMIETGELFQLTTAGISDCIIGKNRPAYEGFELLVEVPVFRLPCDRWPSVFETLRSVAAETPFQHVHIISSHEMGEPFGYQLK
jgi:hypothetical protein